MDKQLVPYGNGWQRCTVCGRIGVGLEHHRCSRPLGNDSRPTIKETLREWDNKGRAEVDAAQKKGGWNE